MNEFLFKIANCSVINVLNPTANKTLQVLNPDGSWTNVQIEGTPVVLGPDNYSIEICAPGDYRIAIPSDCCDGTEQSYVVTEISTGGGGSTTVDAPDQEFALGDNGEVIIVDMSTSPVTATLADGTPYTGSIASLNSDVEYESTNTCWKDPNDFSIIYREVSTWDVSDMAGTIQTVWLDNTDAIVGQPIGVILCDTQAVTPDFHPIVLHDCVGNQSWRLRVWNDNPVAGVTATTPFEDVFSNTDEFGLPFVPINTDPSIGVSPDLDSQLPDTYFTAAEAPFVSGSIQAILEGWVIAPMSLLYELFYSDTNAGSYTGAIYVGTSPEDARLLSPPWTFSSGPPVNNQQGSTYVHGQSTSACEAIYVRIYYSDSNAVNASSLGVLIDNPSILIGQSPERFSSVGPVCQTQVQWVEEGQQPVLDQYLKIGDCTSGSGSIIDAIQDQTLDQQEFVVDLVTEVYRIDASQFGTSTPSIDPGDVPTIGNTVTITAPYQSIAWRYMRDTDRDPGNGSVNSLDVNGFTYFPGEDTPRNQHDYIEVGYSVNAITPEQFVNDVEFTANAVAPNELIVEIIVVRKA